MKPRFFETTPEQPVTYANATPSRSRRKLRAAMAAASLLAATACGATGNQAPVTVTQVATGEVPDSNGPAAPTGAEAPDLPSSSAHPKPGAPKFTEIRQYSSKENSGTFRNYQNMSGAGPRLEVGDQIEVDCTAFDMSQFSNSTQGTYYHIAGPDAVKGYWTPSNTYYNQADIHAADQNNLYDPRVPLCEDSPNSPLPHIQGSQGH